LDWPSNCLVTVHAGRLRALHFPFLPRTDREEPFLEAGQPATIGGIPHFRFPCMANIGVLLKSEITRLARKEVKAQTAALRKSGASHRRDIADLKRQVTELQRQLAVATRTRKRATQAESPESDKARFSAKGLKSNRARLELSAADYGRLAGVSGQSIYAWETGKTVPRQAQVGALAALRGMGKREALARLEAMAP
jgi:DNA-binding transcriptional regulator YiaG